MRVLVTGSRTWTAEAAVYVALEDVWARYGPFTLIHGAAKGADTIAAFWAEMKAGVTEEPHPADWFKHGNAAGPIRNKEMVDSLTPGQDIVLAFQRQHSRGTQNTIDLARLAGVEVRVWSSND